MDPSLLMSSCKETLPCSYYIEPCRHHGGKDGPKNKVREDRDAAGTAEGTLGEHPAVPRAAGTMLGTRGQLGQLTGPWCPHSRPHAPATLGKPDGGT